MPGTNYNRTHKGIAFSRDKICRIFGFDVKSVAYPDDMGRKRVPRGRGGEAISMSVSISEGMHSPFQSQPWAKIFEGDKIVPKAGLESGHFNSVGDCERRQKKQVLGRN